MPPVQIVDGVSKKGMMLVDGMDLEYQGEREEM